MKAAGIGTIIPDEAHHLRTEWWKALSRLIERIGDVYVIALTATPPYDAVRHEWSKYEELCGVIDEEISVPELVKAGTLSPHQDFVWAVVPSEREKDLVAHQVEQVTQLSNELLADEQFSAFVVNHPWLSDPQSHTDALFRDPQAAIAMLSYLKARSLDLPAVALSVLDLSPDDVPDLTLPRWESLLTHYLFACEPPAELPELVAARRKLVRRLRECHVLTNRQIRLSDSKVVKRHLTQHTDKIGACVHIHRHELAVRGERLRQVILTDYTRDDDLEAGLSAPVCSLGAWPIYRQLLLELGEAERSRCALLTGRLVKVASIWHIVAIALNRKATDALFWPTLYWPGLVDLCELDMRFKTFVGLDTERSLIENSLTRLHLPFFKREIDRASGAERIVIDWRALRSRKEIESLNVLMIQRLRDLSHVRTGWEVAIAFGVAGLFALPKFLRAARLAIRHLPIDGSIHQVGLAVRDTLCALGLLDSPASKIAVESYSESGSVYVSISGGSFRDQQLFSDCMREILGPIENPRYLIIREGNVLGRKRKDYHAVPTLLGVRKEMAELFLQAWQRRVGPADLIYTRAAENRPILLRARARAFSNAAAAVERLERWW